MAPTPSFEPIAIVGQACVLPGALTPAALWEAVRDGRDLLTRVPEGRWRVDPELVLTDDPGAIDDHTWTDRGGYVQGFDAVYSAEGFAVPPEELDRLDPLVSWLVHCGRAALGGIFEGGRGGAIVGNLSYPTASLSRLAEAVWLDDVLKGFLDGKARALCAFERPDPRARFMSGLPVNVLCRALDLAAGGFALDAACSSSLYAIKLACDWLHDRRADVMLAGGVNRADDLFIHIGFCALQAMSRTGRSRPFHREADGLVPAEGAALVALRRLADAEADGDAILGVIRGVGLSNDGRGRGMLAPCPRGQERALREAYRLSGLDPADVSLVECHATGTPVGDVVEVESMARVFEAGVAVGSLKSNLGHLITASGAAGLIKVLEAMRYETLPPSINAEEPLTELSGSPLRVVTGPEPWERRAGRPLRAGINNFGFGGNNAHLIVEEWRPGAEAGSGGEAKAPPRAARAVAVGAPEIAIVGVQAMAADGVDRADFERALYRGESRIQERHDPPLRGGIADSVELPLTGLRFPPRDLDETLAQQLTVLRTVLLACEEIKALPVERTGVLVGMQCDAEVARYGARLRMPGWARKWGEALGVELGGDWLVEARRGVGFLRKAAGVVGAMPNIPANRINGQLDLGGPSFTVSAEELSGVVCLELAARALREGELDAALVGAVDLCCEPVHAAAAREVLGESFEPPGDAAVVLVLKRLDDARRDGDQVFAVLEEQREKTPILRLGPSGADGVLSLTPQLGHAHAASGLLHVAAAALACRHRATPGGLGKPPAPWWPPDDGAPRRTVEVEVAALGGETARVTLAEADRSSPLLLEPIPSLHVVAGADRREVLSRLERGKTAQQGPCRLVLVARDSEQLEERRERARELLEAGSEVVSEQGIYFRERPLAGELAFVFTGPAGAYPGMGRELVLAFPRLLAGLHERCRCVEETGSWVYAHEEVGELSPHQQLWGSSYLAQLHAELTRGLWGLAPRAAIGFCSGETNALFAMGAWNDLDAFFPELLEAGVFSRHISGEYRVVRQAWDDPKARWTNWRVLWPAEKVIEALAYEPRCRLTIVSAPADVVIGGDPDACRRVVERVGRSRAYPLGYDVTIHCPEMEIYAGPWRELHHRATRDVPGVRFYTSATCDSYRASADAAADALTGMALQRVDFPRLIRKAYDDGVRVFVEHGPRDGCTKWIDSILEGREHLAVALDRGGRSSVEQAVLAAAELLAAGVEVDVEALLAVENESAPRFTGPTKRYPAHPEPFTLPPVQRELAEAVPAAEYMQPAPPLPPVLTEPHAVHTLPTRPAPPPLAAGHARVAEVHRQFLAEQTQVHEQFLALRQRSLARMAQVARVPVAKSQSSMAAPVAPAPVPAAPARTPVPAAPARTPGWSPRGPRFDRPQLEVLASGRISSVLGPLFEKQDHYERQVRLPEPPLLLVDRVVGLDAEPGSMGKGTIWTETDVTDDAWYLHEGTMPSGIVVEAGQSDLLLISYLGIDFLNRGERVYRLLGCELTNHGKLPRVGDTLRYAIHVDGHARAGDVRLFFFHYDCYVGDELRLKVRNAQAGFFTDQELAESGGVLWDPADGEHDAAARCDPPPIAGTRRRFSEDQVRAFSEGRAHECFGPGFERMLTHTRTPRIQPGKMLLLDEVTELDPRGGPWGKGYLRVENRIHPDDWTMVGHFKNDPCMPGTLMCEGCLQAMAFYMAAMGCTVDRDGWLFDPVPDETYKLQCRGQVIPSSKRLTYEVFVEEFVAGPIPTLFADILGTCDGLKIFHGRRMGLRLIPDWPMTSMDLSEIDAAPEDAAPDDDVPPTARRALVPERPVAEQDGFRFDYRSLLACAWGRPSEAFGAMAQVFDGTRHIARLPGPPYHFMSRVTRVDGEMGSMKPGASIELEYDIPPDAWYFRENGAEVVPFCVLLEAVLQPCGWLAVYIGCPGSADVDLYFRNLDGTGTVHAELPPDAGTLRTRTTLKSISKMGTIILVSFDVECRVSESAPSRQGVDLFGGDRLVYSLDTGFGFFPAEALASQVGLPVSDGQRKQLAEPSDFVCDLTQRPARYFAPGAGSGPRLADPMLLMLDRVSGYWPGAGRAGLGRLRGEKDVDPAEWFFKAHFFQDPVQPGSLGLEAMLQLLQFYMLHEGLGEGIPDPRFEAIAVERPFTWKYRGQVTPEKERVTVEMEILERGRDERGAYAVAESSLWVDGLRIYHSPDVGMRIVPGSTSKDAPDEEILDPDRDTWLRDHRPNWTLPTLPLMSMVDRLAAAATRLQDGLEVVEIRDVRLTGWLTIDRPRRLKTEARIVSSEGATVVAETKLLSWRESATASLSRFEPVATGTVVLACARGAKERSPAERATSITALAPLEHAEPASDPYAAGMLFHGPAFQLLRRLSVGKNGSTAWLDAGGGSVPFGLLNQALLDAAVHGILHDELERWSDEVPRKHIAYPFRLDRATFLGPAPREGEVRCETRLAGFGPEGERFPRFHIQLSVVRMGRAGATEVDARVWADLELVEVMIPMGPHADDRKRRIDFRDGRFVEGAGLSRLEEGRTLLCDAEVRSRDWLKGSVACAYGARSVEPAAMTRELAIKDHVSQRARVHPARVEVSEDGAGAVAATLPLTRFPIRAVRSGEEVTVTDAGPPHLDLEALRAFGRQAFKLGPWLGEDLSLGLCSRFLGRLELEDPAAIDAIRGRPALYLGNHQVQIESMIFPMVTTAATGVHIVTVAKEEHRTGWVGPLSDFTYRYPGVDYPRVIIYFDQSDPASMFGVLDELRRELTDEGHSVFIHVEGELGLSCRQPVDRLSSVFIDLAQELSLPIVPVRLAGALPVEPLDAPLDFPLGFARQDYFLGRPLLPEELAPLTYAQRRRRVLDALNTTGPALLAERPNPPDPTFAARVERLRDEHQLDGVRAVVRAILEELPEPSEQTRRLLSMVEAPDQEGPADEQARWLASAVRWLRG
jgi:acyl transferase domain-containing protein/3-hydroxymyristoyl/3-hydroxydecanoyl-(acyl carrier protein) dehydratase